LPAKKKIYAGSLNAYEAVSGVVKGFVKKETNLPE
jgi:hypothetical protein